MCSLELVSDVSPWLTPTCHWRGSILSAIYGKPQGFPPERSWTYNFHHLVETATCLPIFSIFPSKTCNSLWINTAVDLLVNAVILKLTVSTLLQASTWSTLWKKGRPVSADCPNNVYVVLHKLWGDLHAYVGGGKCTHICLQKKEIVEVGDSKRNIPKICFNFNLWVIFFSKDSVMPEGMIMIWYYNFTGL